MWVAGPADDRSLNAAATDLVMITAHIPNQTIHGRGPVRIGDRGAFSRRQGLRRRGR